MATRFYLPSSNAIPATADTYSRDNGTFHTYSSNFAAFTMTTSATKELAAMSSIADTRSHTVSTAYNICVAQWQSPWITASSITDWDLITYQWSLQMAQSNLASNSWHKLDLWQQVWMGDVTGYVYWYHWWAIGPELTTSRQSRHHSTAIGSPAAGTTEEGNYPFRFIANFGYEKNSTGSYTTTVYTGDSAASDLDASDTDTGIDNPWLEFNADFTLLTTTNTNQLMMRGVGT